jgi:Heparinase II/III-like protein
VSLIFSAHRPVLNKVLIFLGVVLISTVILTFFSMSGCLSPTCAQRADVLLKALRPKHPRLLVLDEDLTAVKQNIANDVRIRRWYERLQGQARKMLDEPPVERTVNSQMLGQSRDALRRISTLAGLYRLDGDTRKASRARTEMLTAANLSDWHPKHFLDTAEMTSALAIGYDWLFDYLSPEDRSIIRRAIVEKGLKQGKQSYLSGTWWTKTSNNWNQVCNAGMTLGALALADDEPELASNIISEARSSIGRSMLSFGPDGGDEEGPVYWNYATKYNVFYLAALHSALGTDFDFKRVQGLADTGKFRIQMVGPMDRTFNYADANDKLYSAPQMFWYAREFHQPSYALNEGRIADRSPDIFHLLWSNRWNSTQQEAEQLPLDAMFRAVDVAIFRSGWKDKMAFYIGFKGGSNEVSHGHLDLGTFVLDALGERWALDLGPDDYELPGYFNKERWTYYRARTEGHNTLTIDGENQNLTGHARLVAFRSTPQRAFAVADLTDAYKPKVSLALRGVALLDRQRVLVQDELEAPRPVDVVWNFHTSAKVDLQGNRAVLSQGKVQIKARILSPEGARFEAISANPPPPQRQQSDVSNLVIRLPKRTTNIRVSVLIDSVDSEFTPPLEPLKKWMAVGQLRN